MEKAFFPYSDKEKGTICNLLPHLFEDEDDNTLNFLRVSSVVDGTKIEGRGIVDSQSYKWKIAIESATNSIAQIPDRFFDVYGRSYPIDINRKVSVHSLPDYENYKSAIIYKINSRSKVAPPFAKIIFDAAMTEKYQLVIDVLEQDNYNSPVITLAQLLILNGYTIHADGILTKVVDNEIEYYYPMEALTNKISYTEKIGDTYNFSINEKLCKILDEDIIELVSEQTINANALTDEKVNSTYYENHAMTDLIGVDGQIDLDMYGSVAQVNGTMKISCGDYLAILVDNHDNYTALIGCYANAQDAEPRNRVIWYNPATPIKTSQFKGLDMWIRFSGLNEMIYFLITKYVQDIVEIEPSFVNANEGDETWDVDDKVTTVEEQNSFLRGQLWAYVNPRTMKPYSDDYWFHQGEPYLIKSLTLATKEQKPKAKKITLKVGTWPGMYMLVGETWIRDKDTGKDERMQIRIPYCKVKSDNSLQLEAGGEPVTFNLELEVAKSSNNSIIEITTYDVAEKMVKNEDGTYQAIDGASRVIFE